MAGGSIKLFQFNQKYCQTVGIYVPRSDQNRYKLIAIQLIFVVCVAQFATATVAFMLNDANSMGEYGAAFFALICTIECMVAYFITIWKLEDVLKFIENCEAFIEKRDDKSIAYKEFIMKIEQRSEWFCFALLTTLLLNILFTLFYTGVHYYMLDFGVESFHLYPPTEWPFDWKTPIGYLVAWFGESVGLAAIVFTIMPFFIYLLGSCWLFIFVADDITKDLIAFNLSIEAATTKRSNTNRAEMTKQLCTIIQIYADAKQCVEEFNKIYRYSLFVLHLWTLLCLSSSLVTLQFQIREDDWNAIEMVITVIVLIWAFAINFLVCELGQWVTDQYAVFGDGFCSCNWYPMSIEMQRMYLIFLSDTQQPIHIQCYSGIVCSRETFKKITDKGFSYFMILRRIK